MNYKTRFTGKVHRQMANYQGKLDGLCGPYAIVNAFERCGVVKTEELFEIACRAPARRRWPDLLWEGTSFGDLQRMVKQCMKEIEETQKLRVTYPFMKMAPRTNEEYWKSFDLLFKERSKICCMVLGLTRPSWHWIVAYRDKGTRVSFVDTDPHKPFQRKNRSMLHAGSRNGNPNKWIIDRSELILFEEI